MVTNRGSKALLHLHKGLVINTIFCAGRGDGTSDHAGNENNGDGGMVDNDGGGVVINGVGGGNNSGSGVNIGRGGVNNSGGGVNNSGGGVINGGGVVINGGGGVNNSGGGVKNGSGGGVVINGGGGVINGGGGVINGGGGVNDSDGLVNNSGGGGVNEVVINGGEVVLVVQGRHIPASRRTLALVSNFFKVCFSSAVLLNYSCSHRYYLSFSPDAFFYVFACVMTQLYSERLWKSFLYTRKCVSLTFLKHSRSGSGPQT
jgi:hypothetical protein